MLSIIIPSYKGAKTLEKHLSPFIEYLSNKEIEYEVIVVDDGSNDNGKTEEIAIKNGCKFIGYANNKGKGEAVRQGMKVAKGDFKLYTDVDIPFQYSSIDQFLHYLDFKEFDIVIGDRTLPDSSYLSEIPKSRKLGSLFFTFLVGRFVTSGLNDTQCGIKGFKSNIADDLFSVSTINGFAFDVELLYVALKRNYDIKRLPVRLRNNNETSVSLMRHAPGMLRDILLLKINHISGKYKKQK
ncbi:MAG: glycosyltransferase [Flavobacteriales bacterium]|nr:glycosyltransferase [Flavobacteriales bacterium]